MLLWPSKVSSIGQLLGDPTNNAATAGRYPTYELISTHLLPQLHAAAALENAGETGSSAASIPTHPRPTQPRDGNLHGFFSLVTSHRADRHCSNSTHTLGVTVHFILLTVIKERDTCENNDSESNI